MADSPAPHYQRIARSNHATAFQRLQYSLWHSDDHLLQVANQHFSEQYQRFYFRDIQAIVIQATPLYRRINLWLGIALLLFLGVIVITGFDNWELAIGLVVPLAALAAVWIINLIRGPSCACYIQTAVQTERLYAVDRQRGANRFLAVVEPLIAAAQGGLTPAEAQTKAATLPAIPPVTKAPPVRPPLPVPAPVRHCTGALHRVLAIALFVDVTWCAVDLAHDLTGGFWNVMGVLFALVEIILVIATVIYQAGSDFPVRLKRLTWGLLAFILVTFTVALGFGIASGIMSEFGDSFTHDRMVELYLDLATILFLLPGGWALWRGVADWRKE